MSQGELFEASGEAAKEDKGPATRRENARVRKPDRAQIRWEPRSLEEVLPQTHTARAIWSFLDRLNLAPFYGSIQSVLDRPGRPATEPQMLLALWLQATVDGVGSARQLARLCEQHDAYRWLCGGVPVNYHTLSDFRALQKQALDELLSQIIAALMAAGAVTLERVAQDGMRVRASAGAASFRRKDTLEACLKEARARVAELGRQGGEGESLTKRQQAAQERAAKERVERVEQALAYLPQLQASKDVQQKRFARTEREKITPPRASTTDPEARIMKMADGGFRPAYNLQLATDAHKGVIVGVDVTAAGTDSAQALPMVEQVERRTGRKPKDYLVDGGYTVREQITALSKRGITLYAPVRMPRSKPETERYRARYGDSPEVIAWRERMATEEGKAAYRQRGAVAEWANAQVRRHGVPAFNLRGLNGAISAALLAALAHNLMRWLALTP